MSTSSTLQALTVMQEEAVLHMCQDSRELGISCTVYSIIPFGAGFDHTSVRANFWRGHPGQELRELQRSSVGEGVLVVITQWSVVTMGVHTAIFSFTTICLSFFCDNLTGNVR